MLYVNIAIIFNLNLSKEEGAFSMGKPKKRTSPRRTGLRRSHLVHKLARAVNAKSPVKVITSKRKHAEMSG